MSDQKLREQLVKHLKGRNAFAPVEQVIEDVPFEKVGIVPDGLPYSFYQQVYHLWYAQKDIIDYCQQDNYEAGNWPDDYWPENSAPENEKEWKNLTEKFFNDRDQFCEYLMDSSNDLFEPFSQNENHNLLREAELIIEHNAYHSGQLFVIKRLLSS